MGDTCAVGGGEFLLPAVRICAHAAYRAVCQVVQKKDTSQKITNVCKGVLFLSMRTKNRLQTVQQYDLSFNLDIFEYLLHVSMQQNPDFCL